MKWRTGAAAAVFVVRVFAAPAGQSQQVEWFTYGGDPASSKYSPADDITPQNVARLSIAWQWEHGEKPLEHYGTTPYRFENQPLMVDGVLYITTPYNNAVALDAETGRELWRFDSVRQQSRHGALGDLNPQLPELAVDARGAPQRIGACHVNVSSNTS